MVTAAKAQTIYGILGLFLHTGDQPINWFAIVSYAGLALSGALMVAVEHNERK